MNNELYFIDYDEDNIVPCGGRKDLVKEYEKIMKENKTPIFVYNTKEELMNSIIEFTSQAKEEIISYEYLEDDEMRDLIENIEERESIEKIIKEKENKYIEDDEMKEKIEEEDQ